MKNTLKDAISLWESGRMVSIAMGAAYARAVSAAINTPFVRDNFMAGALGEPRPTSDSIGENVDAG